MKKKRKLPRTITVGELQSRWSFGPYVKVTPTDFIFSELRLYALYISAHGIVKEGRRRRQVTLSGLYEVAPETVGAVAIATDVPRGSAMERVAGPRFPRFPVYPDVIDDAGRTIRVWTEFHSINEFRVLLRDVKRLESTAQFRALLKEREERGSHNSQSHAAAWSTNELRGLLEVAPSLPGRQAKPAPDNPKPTGRRSQVHRERCRAIAATIWEREPGLTIEDMIDRPEITAHGQEGKAYTRGQLRKWINDLCPNRQPGRRPKARN